ncbi:MULTISPECIES: hypothetical protein [unclassified Methylobacterium]|uniref:hypothetical protein n=1 Tax=unclassified Methylobacterium TaxID=2615210 RepID=UPI002269A1E0|nr:MULTISPECIES: hypothetical protein [unclassified Methylobacterium]
MTALRDHLRQTHGDEAATAPLLTDWITRPHQGGGFRLNGLCWGSTVGDTIMTTSRIVEMTESYARTQTGSLYVLGREDREHKRERRMKGQRGPVLLAPAEEPEPAFKP